MALDSQLRRYYNDTTQNLRALKFIIVGFIRLKQFHKTISLANEYLDLIPSDTNMILLLAYRLSQEYFEKQSNREQVELVTVSLLKPNQSGSISMHHRKSISRQRDITISSKSLSLQILRITSA